MRTRLRPVVQAKDPGNDVGDVRGDLHGAGALPERPSAGVLHPFQQQVETQAFLEENPDLARAAKAAGITFVGPPAEVLELAGNKVAALKAARDAGVPSVLVHTITAIAILGVVAASRPVVRR